MSDAYWSLIRSDRVSANTRAALERRAAPNDSPGILTEQALRTLSAVVQRILPGVPFDLARRIDQELRAGSGDGWRFADLPPDPEALPAGLAVLDAACPEGFAALAPDAQDAMLARADTLGLRHWFEDLRGTAVRLYVAHPDTLARIGYSGIGYGGDAPRKPGFQAIGPGEREAWEPIASP